MGIIQLATAEEHKISTNLDNALIYVYGEGGVGKTTFGSLAPSPILFAFEKGYNAIGGIVPVDINSWTDFKSYLRQLKQQEVKDRFKTVIIDTVDKAAAKCEKYICNMLGIENIGDGGWTTNGWAKVKKEWDDCINEIAMQGYSIIFISHAKDKTFKRKDGSEYNKIVPSCSSAYNEIVRNMCDIQAYIQIENGERKMILRSGTDEVECKSRYKYMVSEIDFGYSSLVAAVKDAISKENQLYVTTDKSNNGEQETTFDFESLITEFNSMVETIMKNDSTKAAEITKVIESYLGRGKKVSDANAQQAEFIYLINEELKELL